jgi:hypothetical protein
MQRGCVSTLAISVNMARERAALSPMDSNSAGDLRLWSATGGGLDCASAAEVVEQMTKTAKAIERTGISLPSSSSDKG